MSTYTLRTRPPTGRVPWPLILLEGGEKSGKSWAAAVLSASPRVGQTFWIDLGEGAGDEYGSIPGVRYEVVEHNGTWQQIIGAVEAIRDIARQAADAGDPPVVLVIDSMTAIWDMLKDWATVRARSTENNEKKLRANPNAEIVVSTNFWNDSNARHRKLMTILMTWPGIAVVTARGKDVAEMGANGKPTGDKVYKVEGHKDLAFDATVWVRMSRTAEPVIVGARSVHAGIQPGSDKPRTVPGLELDRLVFDILKCNPAAAHVRDLVQPTASAADLPDDPAPTSGGPTPTAYPEPRPATSPRSRELQAEIDAANDKDSLAAVWRVMVAADKAGEITQPECDQLKAAWRDRKAAAIPTLATDAQHRHMHVLWGQAGFANDRDGRLAFTGEILGRDIASSKDILASEVDKVISRLQTFIEQNTPPAEQAAAE